MLKTSKCLYEPTPKQRFIEREYKEYKNRLKLVRQILKHPDEVDILKISFDEKYYIFEFDPTVGDDNLVIGTKYYKSRQFRHL